jgi:putative two-component system response regulator
MSGRKHVIVALSPEDDGKPFLDVIALLGHEALILRNGKEVMDSLGPNTECLVLDSALPGMDGFEVARAVRLSSYMDAPILFITDSPKERRLAIGDPINADDCMPRSADSLEIGVRVGYLLGAREAESGLLRHRNLPGGISSIEDNRIKDAMQTASVAQRHAYQAQIDAIERLALAADYKDHFSGSHILRISRYTEIIARGMGLPNAEVETIRIASIMHDVGKVGIPESILNKPGKLNDGEWEIMKRHSEIGAQILTGSSSPILRAGEVIALTHHERWSGTGYPNGLKGASIPLLGRITAVADVFDALTSERPYKEPFSNETSASIISGESGKHFDPEVVEAFMESTDEMVSVQRTYRDMERGRIRIKAHKRRHSHRG